MPYINIREADITPVRSFETLDNAVLIFGFDFHRYTQVDVKMADLVYENTQTKIYGNRAYKIYTSLSEFLKDTAVNINKIFKTSVYPYDFTNDFVYRPFKTAYDCLLRGLPVIYVPLDDYIDDRMIIKYTDADGNVDRYIEYLWLYSPLIANDAEYWHGQGPKGYTWTDQSEIDENVNNCNDVAAIDGWIHPAEKALFTLLKDNSELLPLSDRINMPITFITTCGWEGLDNDLNTYRNLILGSDALSIKGAIGTRLDILYLYDFRPEITPEDLHENGKSDTWVSFDMPQLVNIVYPWGHYNLYSGTNNAHMPGSYGWLMAYATSIKNNFPWLATAGIHRGRIPNIVALDYDIKEAYLHQWQGDDYGEAWSASLRINPIIDLGANYGKVIFGNRTCFPESAKEVVFRTFLNVRLLLIYLHKQLFRVSMTHMFEPNDDIVWLSFKQAANTLLDKMVTGRGIQWYKWQKLRPEDSQGNLILGQIKAKLTIRPIEAVESFDITITMTDQEIEVVEGEE